MSLFFIFQIALICVLVYLLFAFIFFICFCHFVKPKNKWQYLDASFASLNWLSIFVICAFFCHR